MSFVGIESDSLRPSPDGEPVAYTVFQEELSVEQKALLSSFGIYSDAKDGTQLVKTIENIRRLLSRSCSELRLFSTYSSEQISQSERLFEFLKTVRRHSSEIIVQRGGFFLEKNESSFNLPFTEKVSWLSEHKEEVCKIETKYFPLFCFPDRVTVFSHLRNLSLLSSNLLALPNRLNLPELESLNCERNKIKALPDEFHLPSLHTLHLGQNCIEKLSESVGSLGKLQVLDLRANPLSTLHDSLKKCSQLQQLVLFSTPITECEKRPQAFGKSQESYIKNKLYSSGCLPSRSISILF
jgi:hypothetical protein